MKRDFLKSLGIEDKETIDKILDENSADIGKAKGDTDALNTRITDLENQLAKKTTEFDALKESTKDYEDLSTNNKKLEADNAQLLADKKQLEIDRDSKVSEILKTHAIENYARDVKAKNVKAVMALLDMDKITYKDSQLSGHAEQFDALISGENTSFLFGETTPKPPVGTHINNPPTVGGASNPPTSKTLVEAIGKALGNK